MLSSSPVSNNKYYLFGPNKNSHNNSSVSQNEFYRVYNSISNIYNHDQINNAFEQLVSVPDRIKLMDHLIKRRTEIKEASMLEKINKIEPLINKLKKNYLDRTKILTKDKNENDLKNLIENGEKTERSPTLGQHYKRLSLIGGVLIKENQENPNGIKRRSQIIHNTDLLPKVSEEDKEFEEREKKQRKAMLSVINRFNEYSDKNVKKDEKKLSGILSPRVSFHKKSYVNSKVFKSNFHLIPIELPDWKADKKKYETSINVKSRRIEYKPPIDRRKVNEVLEQDLINFSKNHRESDILSMNYNEIHKDLAMIETKAKMRLKDFYLQERVKDVQKQYYFRDTYENRNRQFHFKCPQKSPDKNKQEKIFNKTSKIMKRANERKLKVEKTDYSVTKNER